jgi:hypothetical protein
MSWENLTGRPVRRAHARVSKRVQDTRKREGLIKVRLAHHSGGSHIIPDVLIGMDGARYFIPSFFGPPRLAFGVPGIGHTASFDVDVGSPRAPEAARLHVTFRSGDLVRTYRDGAQLYRCAYTGPRAIGSLASGLSFRLPDDDFALQAYHHTGPVAAASIRRSGELRSSPWNLAGTRRLINVAYAYFTTLPQVRGEEDLRRIAMSSEGRIGMQTTSDRMREEVLELKVYRGDTRGRTSSLAFRVPSALVAPAHLYLHPLTRSGPAWYEVIGPEIVRVGVEPGSSLNFLADGMISEPDRPKEFDYVVLGDASTIAGLAAPYEEEDTRGVAHLERLDGGQDLFEFWRSNANSDQVAGRAPEPRVLAP